MAISDERKYRLLNDMLSTAWFVGAYTDADRLMAAIAPDLGVPAAAPPAQYRAAMAQADQMATADRSAIPPRGARLDYRRQNPLDRALWETWHGAGFDAAAVRPRPLEPASPAGFLTHEAARPFFLLTRWARREGAPRLPFVRAKSGLRSGIARADRARDAGQWPLAARHYRQALSEEPELPAIWVQYGHMLKESGDVAAAEAAYRESLRLDPENADTYLQLGHALNLQRRVEAAEAAYLSAVALDRRLDFAIEALGGASWMRAQIDEVLRRKPAATNDLASEGVSGSRGS